MPADENEVNHPLFARVFAWGGERLAVQEADERNTLMEGLSGKVIEVGAGSGLNFAIYPPEVTDVLAVEPEQYMRRQAEQAALNAPVPVRVVAGVGERLPAEDASFDAAVTSLVLCSVRDPAQVLAEIKRVLRPGGELRFYEHVGARRGTQRILQRALDATIWPLIAGGCHTTRDTEGAIRAAGFEVTNIRRFNDNPMHLPNPVAPHILGVAKKP